MMKNGKLYGSIIPSDVHSLRVQNLSLGEKVELQILALTEHPVGRHDTNTQQQDHKGQCTVRQVRLRSDKPVHCKAGQCKVRQGNVRSSML